ncbi:uncharacterized protein LOC135336300 isoform X2 [Halichondria panicea]|uniref:uncharacterized protein LOC135336300 isoform X2 n=1 Tax=Halichondria panicea TaxID=6063 RepID=UPI00312B2C33
MKAMLFPMAAIKAVIVMLLSYSCLCHAQDWSVRLRGGQSPFEGRVEVLVNNSWGTIQDTNWGLDDALVVCKQLGFSAADSAVSGRVFAPADLHTPVLLTDVQCSDGAVSLQDCEYQTGNSLPFYNLHTRDAGVRCAVKYSIRLQSMTSSRNIGRLGIQRGTIWSPVCYDSLWTTEQSSVACRQLGYDQIIGSQGVNMTGAVTVSPLNCTGSEPNLQSCRSPVSVLNNCSSGLVVELECAGTPLQLHPPTTSFLSCTSVTLQWTTHDNYRGHEIDAYTIRYRPYVRYPLDTQLPWITMRVDPSSSEEQSLTIGDLAPLSEYEVQVSATNTLGSSPFSDNTVITTLAPVITAPGHIQIDTRGPTTANISWTEPMTCGIDNLFYEISYNVERSGLSSVTRLDSVTHTPDSVQRYEMRGLLPYTQYSVRVRVVGYVDGGDGTYMVGSGTLFGRTAFLSSNFSDITVFTTNKSLPTGSPQAFVAFFSLLQSTAHFEWQSVSPHLANGVILNYIISCRYMRNGDDWNLDIKDMVSNSTFTYSLQNLLSAAHYECSVAALNEVGEGPASTPILFSTPADLNRRPSAPRNVVFEVMRQNRDSLFIGAQWEMFVCESNFTCVELLGYVITCRAEISREEVRNTVWLSDFQDEDEVFENARVQVKPFTRYDCSVASLNTYGVGQPGSIISLKTPETIPKQSATKLYATNVGTDSVQLHWTYEETPRAGELNGFALYLYKQDTRFPGRTGSFVIREYFNIGINQDQTSFSYLLMYLDQSVTYNVYIAAATVVGEGPQERISVTTHREAPSTILGNVFTSITSSREPFPVLVEWSVSATSVQSIDYIGFIVSCFDNSTGTANELLRHVVLDSQPMASYSANILLPANCEMPLGSYQCSVFAFNERGEGRRTTSLPSSLPCTGGGDGLTGSFLANPYAGITFLVLVILLIILLITTVIICCVCIGRYEKSTKKEEHYSTVPFDEGYISMAPTGSNSSAMKQPWSRNNVHPPSFLSRGGNPRLSIDQDIQSHYDEISVGRASKTENIYDEIPLRLTPQPPTPRRSNASSMRSSPTLQNGVTCLSIHSISEKSFDLDESQVTTMTDITKIDVPVSNGAKLLSPVSSEENLAKAKPVSKDKPKTSPFKDQPQPSARGRTSGYVEVVTTKDGKRCVRELGNTSSVDMESYQPFHQDGIQEQAARRTSLREQGHSYQNVAEIRRPRSVSSTQACITNDERNRKSIPNQTNRQQITSADFQLSTVDDSEV